MESSAALQSLHTLYAFYAEFVVDFPAACSAGCAVCCTPNVVLSSLEARYLLQAPFLQDDPDILGMIKELASGKLYRPTCSINHLAQCCLAGQEPPEDNGEHVEGRCALLDDSGCCRVYEHRPFACRAMSSKVVCHPGSEAEMDPFLVTVNLAMHQIIEHLDQGGVTGIMPDILPPYDQVIPLAEQRGREVNDQAILANRPLPGFLVPPEEQRRFADFMSRLAVRRTGSGCLGDYLPGQ